MSSIRLAIGSRVRVAAALLFCGAGMLACGDGVPPSPAYVPVTAPDQPAPQSPAPVGPSSVDDGPIPEGRLAFELEVLASPTEPGILPRIYTMRTDGTGVLALTPAGEIGKAPAWSPDGRRLAYESYHGDAAEIWTVRADGTDRALVARGATAPFWLDATHLGYQCDASLCAVRDDGSEQRTLLARQRNRDAEDFAYSLSPDGRTIAFTRITLPGPSAATSHVYVMNADGTGERSLASATEGDSPHWSPVGRSIAFASAKYGTAIADADGGAVQSVSQRDGVALPYGISNPAWSPTGTYVVFGVKVQSFYIARADGTGPIRHVNTPFPADANRVSLVNAWAWTSP
jgi:dipeptidyl aminopeptidase/acylaminoacyl peptidase